MKPCAVMLRGRGLGWGLVLLLAGCSGAAQDAQVASQPGGLGARLSPDPATAETPIRVVLDDPLVAPASCQIEWRRNGRVIAGASGASLDPGQFSKGDRIEASVLAPAVGSASRTARAEVKVLNTPPLVRRAMLVMVPASNGAAYQASAEFVDADRDPATLSYRWFKNGQPMEGEGGSTVPATAIGAGDQLVVEVVASDGESQSPPVRSEAVGLANRPPTFTSQPISPRPNQAEFRYQAIATDPDGDPLRYELANGPWGMSVSAAGEVSWMLPASASANTEYPVRIRVMDGKGGESTQDFTIRLPAADAKR